MAAVKSIKNAVEENNSIAGVTEQVGIISDSMSTSELNNGTYFLGGQKVYVKISKTVMADGTIWGLVSHKSILHDEVCANYSAL